jgi:hypothetical protein
MAGEGQRYHRQSHSCPVPRVYYDTPEKRAFYESGEREGRPHSGNWWLRSEISRIASAQGIMVTIVRQKPAMVTPYYP